MSRRRIALREELEWLARTLDQVIPEGRFDHAAGRTHIHPEDRFVELGHHLPATEAAQVATLCTRRTIGMGACEFAKVAARLYLHTEIGDLILGLGLATGGGGA